MKYLVIVNPISGRGYAEKVIPEIEAGMKEDKKEAKTEKKE